MLLISVVQTCHKVKLQEQCAGCNRLPATTDARIQRELINLPFSRSRQSDMAPFQLPGELNSSVKLVEQHIFVMLIT